MPNNKIIIEPFAGAAGYSLRYPDRDIILVEKYHIVAEVWRFLIGASSRDIMSIPFVEHVDDLPDRIPQGAKWLVGFSMNDATTSPRKQLASGRKKLRDMGRKFEGWSNQKKERIASQVSKIKHWKIVEGDFSLAPNKKATWFIDPPYQLAGKSYIHGPSGLDYVALANWCRTRTGQVIVCENEGASWLPFSSFHSIKSNGMYNRAGVSKEVIWENG
jgi:hypothetical protein